MSDLPVTGERMVADAYVGSAQRQAIYATHIASYRFASRFTVGKDVLDLGCGSGYGAAMVAASARHVTAVDVSADAIRYASEKHCAGNLSYLKIEADRPLPFPDAAFDVVLSFQVIEHVRDVLLHLAEARRVLRAGGVLVVITPNRAVRLLPGQKPWNEWHRREYDDSSLAALFRAVDWHADIQFMTATLKLTALEMRRYRKLKWASLPFTLSVVPERLRIAGLRLLKALGRNNRSEIPIPRVFTEHDVKFGSERSNALNVVAVAVLQESTTGD